MGSGLKEDPKDSRFTWEEDVHGNDSTPRLETGMRPSINTTTQKTGIMIPSDLGV